MSNGHLLSFQKQNGFTIVELLIVIVVIGILASITIIAYNGISARAKVASLQSDLTNAMQQLKIDYTNNADTYPTTLAAANGGLGIKSSSGTGYQYTVDNTAVPATFCLTATNSSTSYYIDRGGAPTVGACTGHTNGANAVITNLATNPSMETDLTGMGSWAGSGGVVGKTNPSGGAYSGSKYERLTWTTAPTVIDGGPSFSISASPNVTYSVSMWVRPSKSQKMYMQMKFQNGGTTLTTPGSTPAILPANVWSNISYSATSPATTTSLNPGAYASSAGGGGSLWAPGDTADLDAIIVVTGSTVYSFADGNTNQWAWNGTTNSSTSYGPFLP